MNFAFVPNDEWSEKWVKFAFFGTKSVLVMRASPHPAIELIAQISLIKPLNMSTCPIGKHTKNRHNQSVLIYSGFVGGHAYETPPSLNGVRFGLLSAKAFHPAHNGLHLHNGRTRRHLCTEMNALRCAAQTCEVALKSSVGFTTVFCGWFFKMMICTRSRKRRRIIKYE